MANPSPTYRYPKVYEEELAKETVGVRLPLYIHEYLKKIPNKAQWLRMAAEAQYQKDLEAGQV